MGNFNIAAGAIEIESLAHHSIREGHITLQGAMIDSDLVQGIALAAPPADQARRRQNALSKQRRCSQKQGGKNPKTIRLRDSGIVHQLLLTVGLYDGRTLKENKL